MADVAKAQLLRALTICLASFASGLAAEEPGFADGATGGINAPLVEIDKAARDNGLWLKDNLEIQDRLPSLEHLDLDRFRNKALNDPRVRRLLDAESDEFASEDAAQTPFTKQRAFLFASFSMPALSLRQMMVEAEEFGVPVVFRGFVENSVFRTREEILRVFGSEEAAKGFNIDPTLFARFDVTAAPAVIVLADALAPCIQPGCAGESPPPHDRISGNIPLRFALETIAEGAGEGARSARDLLDRGSP